ncbi:MAG: hypothetical protein FWH55_11145 [Oscillospiraceae bacterium]|nr:hypothetical protein [Oscillospiraceae bacterium]
MQLIVAIITALLQFMPIVGSANAQATGQALAEQAIYRIYTIPDSDNKSVLISIPLDEAEYLQLYSPPVLRAFTRAALELQQDKLPADAENVTFVLMDGKHIAGEAELHLIGYVFTYLAGGDRGLLSDLHERFRVIDLNVDEARVPPLLIDFVGWMVDCSFS